jgi:glucosamine-phosphate N-acetyltransferase|tara:strand:- start:634 stop:1062 length:429 start_codon:yes stop_codon:yes gene_type:complete
MIIKITKLKKKHFADVLILLSKNLTSYLPKKKEHSKIWKNFISQKKIYAIVVLVENYVAGYGTISFEKKIRGGILGHIEDIVVDKKYQSKGIGKKIIQNLTNVGIKKPCYKITLQCSDVKNVNFYNTCGFKKNGFIMQKTIS